MPHAPQPCAYCRRHAAVEDVFPFCSERCKMADLGQWLTGTYRLAGTPTDPRDSQSVSELAFEHDESGDDPDSQESPS